MPTPGGLLAALLVALGVSQLATLATTVHLHRAAAHRALTLRPGADLAFRAVLWLSTGIKAREWVAVHRRHHARTDVAGDPHSPVLEGFAMVQLANVALYRRALVDGELVRRYARDLPPDRWDRALFDRSLVGLGLGTGILCLALGPVLGVVAAVLHTATYLLLNAAINAIGHTFGRQPHPNTSHNNQWLALLTMGEGLHNNHHAAPTSARMSLARGEVDPGWWCISALQRLGLARLRRTGDGLGADLAA